MSADYRRWFLLNVSPDIRTQIASFTGLHPRGDRTTPLAAVLLTDAELDHTLGLLLLREARGIQLHATPTVHKTLCEGNSLLRTLEAYCPVDWRPVEPGVEIPLADGLSYRAFDVPTNKRARFPSETGEGRVIGYRLTDGNTGRSAVYLPSVPELTPALLTELRDCSCLFIDGTCWRDDELSTLGIAGKTARDMGHLPIDGPGGSLETLSRLPIERKIYIHLNNTNPILLEDSPERNTVERHGMEIAVDGMEVQVRP